MKRIRWILLFTIFIAAVLIFAVSLPVYSQFDCLGLSDCDFNPQRACAAGSEFVEEFIEYARCDYSSCITRYRVHCQDLDDEGIIYVRTLICEDYRNPFCEFGGGEPPE